MKWSFAELDWFINEDSTYQNPALLRSVILDLISAAEYMPFYEAGFVKQLLYSLLSFLIIDLESAKEFNSHLNETYVDQLLRRVKSSSFSNHLEQIKIILNEMLAYFHPIPRGQKFIIDRMEAVRYPGISGGVCHGISNMSMQAFGAEDFERFKQRLIRLNAIPIEYFENDFKNLKAKEDYYQSIQKYSEAQTIREVRIDLLAFLDGVALHQNPTNYPDIIVDKTTRRQDENLTIPLIAPAEHQPMAVHEPFVGTYTTQELADVLNLLCTTLAQHPGDSFSLLLCAFQCGAHHAMNLNYDAKKQCWLLVDPAALPGTYYSISEVALLAQRLITKYTLLDNGEGVVLMSTIYTAKKNVHMKANFMTLGSNPRWNEIHAMSSEKVERAYPPSYSFVNQTYYLKWLYNTKWGTKAIEYASVPSLSDLFRTGDSGCRAHIVKHRPDALTSEDLVDALFQGELDLVRLMIKLKIKPSNTIINWVVRQNDLELANLIFRQGHKPLSVILERCATPEMKKLFQLTQQEIRDVSKNSCLSAPLPFFHSHENGLIESIEKAKVDVTCPGIFIPN